MTSLSLVAGAEPGQPGGDSCGIRCLASAAVVVRLPLSATAIL